VGQKIETERRVSRDGGSEMWVPKGEGTERAGNFVGSEAGSEVGFVVGTEFGSVRRGGLLLG
jgi:hypothetical protein